MVFNIGDPERARWISDAFKNRTMKSIALYSMDKCANCVKRINCGEEMLSKGGVKQPLHFIVMTLMTGCPKEEFKGVGIVSREVGGFLSRNCAPCDKLQICSNYIASFTGVSDEKGQEKFFNQVQKCTKCDRLENCIQFFMTKLKITNFSLIRSGFTMKFRNCNDRKELTTSLDLPKETKGAVGALMSKSPAKEIPKEAVEE